MVLTIGKIIMKSTRIKLIIYKGINDSCKNPYGRVQIFVTDYAYTDYKGGILYKNEEYVFTK